MRVAVLGSWHDDTAWTLRETRDEFAAACRRVGAALVEHGHSLIVGSDRDHTADCHAALGALESVAAGSRTPRILLIRSSSERSDADPRPFAALRRSQPGVFVEYPVTAGSQAVVKLVQTSVADAVLLIGGAEHTEQAGVAAALNRKPLACIGSFGGAAEALNRRFAQAPASWGYDQDQGMQLYALQEPFSDALLSLALRVAWIEGAPKLMIIHGRSRDRDTLKQHLSSRAGRVVVLTDEFAPTEPIPLKFERFAATVDGAIALVTPDDVGALAESEEVPMPRARQNVWIEIGWFWGRRGRSKLLLLTKGSVEVPSDLGNVEHYAYTESPLELDDRITAFIDRLRAAGDSAGQLWT